MGGGREDKKKEGVRRWKEGGKDDKKGEGGEIDRKREDTQEERVKKKKKKWRLFHWNNNVTLALHVVYHNHCQ